MQSEGTGELRMQLAAGENRKKPQQLFVVRQPYFLRKALLVFVGQVFNAGQRAASSGSQAKGM
jgi:hypothetical protein